MSRTRARPERLVREPGEPRQRQAVLTTVRELVAFVGLSTVPFTAPFTPAVEVGWRLAPAHWGSGYATEGARAALGVAFDTLGLSEDGAPGHAPRAR